MLLENRKWPVLSGLEFDRAVCVQGSKTNIVVKSKAEPEARLQAHAAAVEEELRSHRVLIELSCRGEIRSTSALR